jgi:NAD(P)-dependent dehydrogenase (short-subunit alcohol dehydrogenase family)
LFITGASRGIGKAIALKAAADGANIVVAAKTADPHVSSVNCSQVQSVIRLNFSQNCPEQSSALPRKSKLLAAKLFHASLTFAMRIKSELRFKTL